MSQGGCLNWSTKAANNALEVFSKERGTNKSQYFLKKWPITLVPIPCDFIRLDIFTTPLSFPFLRFFRGKLIIPAIGGTIRIKSLTHFLNFCMFIQNRFHFGFEIVDVRLNKLLFLL